MKVKLELEMEVVNQIVGALSKFPYEQVVGTITELARQVKAQTNEQTIEGTTNDDQSK